MTGKEQARRTPQEVLEDHLTRLQAGDLESDLHHNFAEDCAVLTHFGNYFGREGAREAISICREDLRDARLTYRDRIVHGELALLEWTAHGADTEVEDGSDSFLIQNGEIQVMAISYTARPRAATSSRSQPER